MTMLQKNRYKTNAFVSSKELFFIFIYLKILLNKIYLNLLDK
jgi:hypothetical protein